MMYVAALLALVVSLACSGDNDPEPTATAVAPSTTRAPEVTNTPPLEPTRVATSTPFPTRAPTTQVPSTVWLIDVRDGSLTTVYESHEDRAQEAWFEGESVAIVAGAITENNERIRYAPDGGEISREPWEWYGNCTQTDVGAEVGGRSYPDISCGPMTSDGRWMTYRVQDPDAPVPEGRVGPPFERWVIDLTTSERSLILGDLEQCNGDSFFGPAWSPSGRYFYFSDCLNGGRMFLTDVEAVVTRQISSRLPTFDAEPAWAPDRDVLVYLTGDGNTTVEDLDSGSTTSIDGLDNPVRFEPGGQLFYTRESAGNSPETTLYDAGTLQPIAAVPGVPAWHVRLQPWLQAFVPVLATDYGFVAALENVQDCEGTTIYSGETVVSCVEGAFGPAISPDGASVALARGKGGSHSVEGPGFASSSMDVFDVVLVDIATGNTMVLATGAFSGGPYMKPVWSPDGRRLLFVWPFHYGI
jgi:hypothetical protein